MNTMKKEYKRPVIDVFKVETAHLLGNVSNTPSDGTGARQYNDIDIFYEDGEEK